MHLLLVIACVLAAPQPKPAESPCEKGDRTLEFQESCPLSRTGSDAIHRVLDDQVVAWNKGDLKGFMAGYWNSPELSFFSGNDGKRGWEATYERYKKRYQADGQEMGKLEFKDLEIELLGPKTAFVRGRWQLTMKDNKTLGGLFTLIFKELPEGWRIVHDHTSS